MIFAQTDDLLRPRDVERPVDPGTPLPVAARLELSACQPMDADDQLGEAWTPPQCRVSIETGFQR